MVYNEIVPDLSTATLRFFACSKPSPGIASFTLKDNVTLEICDMGCKKDFQVGKEHVMNLFLASLISMG